MILRLFLIAILPVFTVEPAIAQTLQTSAAQAIVIDYNTGTVLFEKNADDQMPTSSMSKVITAYAVFDAIKKGTVALDDKFNVSEKAWRKGGSKMFVEVGNQVAVEDLLRGVIIQSGNDATIVLAEGLSGSEEVFAERLNSIAQTLGMENSHFTNASGWPDENHYSTARDLSILAKALIENFPEFYPYYAETEFTYNDITQQNRNPLLYQNVGADGIKTGHTEDGGYGLIGSGIMNDRRVILVVNGLESVSDRAQESQKLLQWGLQRFKNETVFKTGDIIDTAEVAFGKAQSVNLTTNEDITLTLPRNADRDVKIEISYNGPLIAPIEKGTEVATMTFISPGLPEVTKPLYAAQSVEELGLFAQIVTKAKHLVMGK